MVRRSDLIVVDSVDQAKLECGDLLWAMERGITTWGKVSELGQVVSGATSGRRTVRDITLFESHGLAISDIATAYRIYHEAEQRGLGQELPFGDFVADYAGYQPGWTV